MTSDLKPYLVPNTHSYVYMAPKAGSPAFKIGKANDVYSRLVHAVGLTELEMAHAMCLAVPTWKQAGIVEGILHRYLCRGRLPVDAAVQLGLPADGRTEWFHKSWLVDALCFAKHNSKFFRSVMFNAYELLPSRPVTPPGEPTPWACMEA